MNQTEAIINARKTRVYATGCRPMALSAFEVAEIARPKRRGSWVQLIANLFALVCFLGLVGIVLEALK